MVIVCPECTTKFRVNPERIPDHGAKVRCARCKHVFLAEKPVAEVVPAAAPDEQDQAAPTTTRVEAAVVASLNRKEAVAAAIEESEPEVPAESDFDYNSFREQDSAPEEDPFTFSSDTEESGAAADAEESFSFGAAEQEPDSAETDDFALADKPVETTPAADAPASDEEIASAFTPAEEEPAEVAAPITTPAKPQGGAFASIIRILLLLILAILIIGGVLLYMNGPEQLEQVFQQLIGQNSEQPLESGQIVIKDLQGKFINNQEVGELFVIRGEAVNKFNETRASLQVKGVIFDPNGKPLLQKTIFCGNPISDQELQALPFNKIEELMGNQFGKSLSNMKVNKDQSIPFVIVFRDLPQSLSEFSADITSSKPATP